MSEVRMISPAVKNVPWQERPEGLKGAPIWRYRENPIIGRNPVDGVARIFNSAVVPYEDAFIGVFRGEQVNGIPYIYLGHSNDAIHWEFEQEKIPFKDEAGNDFMPVYAYFLFLPTAFLPWFSFRLRLLRQPFFSPRRVS